MSTLPLSRCRNVTVLCAATIFVGSGAAWGAPSTLDALTSHDASSGLRAALSQGIDTAVSQLGVPNGFLNDPKVAIPLPPGARHPQRSARAGELTHQEGLRRRSLIIHEESHLAVGFRADISTVGTRWVECQHIAGTGG